MRVKVFSFEEYGKNGRWCKITPVDPKDFPNADKVNFDLAPARLLGVSYDEYLYLMTKLFPEKVKVIADPIPVLYWLKGIELFTLIDLLDKRWVIAKLNQEEVPENEDSLR